MDFQSSSVAAKLSTGHSIYDGVFSSATSKFTVSSTLDDYREIFGAASSAASSIPVLEVPELKERKVDARGSSQLDYSNVFGGFADSDSALSYEQLFNQPHKRTKTQKQTRRQGERVSPAKEAKRSGSEEGVELADGAAYESIDGVKKFNMSYNQSNNRSKSFAGVHSVPAYTCLVDQASPIRAKEVEKPVSLPPVVVKEREMESDISVKATSDKPASDAGKQTSPEGGVKAESDSSWKSSIDELFKSNISVLGALPSSFPPFSSEVSRVDKPVSLATNHAIVKDGLQRKTGDNHDIKATEDTQTTDASKQKFGGVAKVQDTYKWRSSGSVDKFFYSGELTQEARPSNIPPFSSMHFDGKGEHEKSMDDVFRNLNRDTVKGADHVSSPPYFEEEADTNSVAAASVAALTKAIEEAQASIQMAKEMMDRKSVGPQSRVKLSFDNNMKPKSRKGIKVAEKASISEEKKARELYNKVDVRVHDSAVPEQVTPVSVHASTVSDVIVTGEEARGKKFVDNGSISTKKIHESKEEFRVSARPEQVTVELEDTDKRSSLTEDQGKVPGKEFQGYFSIFNFFTKKTNALQEAVHVPAQPEQAAVILEDTDINSGVMEAQDNIHVQECEPTPTDIHSGVMEARDNVHVQKFEPTPTDHMHEKAEVSEAADQFYEFGDSSEQDVSEAADQFYEFADSSEPDVSETSQTTEEFYEFADSNEQQDVVENKTAESPREMFLSVDYDEHEKKTDMEAFENSEQVGKKSKAVTVEEQKVVENISNVVREVSMFEDNFELALSQEYSKQEDDESILYGVGVVSDFGENDELTSSCECPEQEDDVNPPEEPRKHEETGKLETTHIKETYEGKRYGDEKRFETQEVPETEHVDVTLVAQEWGENEKIDKEGCVLEENERERVYSESEEGTDNISNEDEKEEVIESVSFHDKEDFEKILEDDRNSERIGKLKETTLNEEKIEEATFQECENTQQEGFEFLKAAERIQLEMDESTRNEKEQKTQDGQEILDCTIEAADNLNEQVVCEDLASKQGSGIDVNCDQDVKESVQLPINNENREVKEVAEISIHLVGNDPQIELVEQENDMVEKEICETDGLAPDARLSERLKQMKDATNTHSLEKDGISANASESESDMSFVQKKDDQLSGEHSVDYNAGEQADESEESGDINSDMMRAEVALDQERNKNSSKFRKRWFGANEVPEPFIKLEGDGNQSESVEEEDVMEEKVISEIEGLASGIKFTEILKQLEDVIDIQPSDTVETSLNGQTHDVQLAREPEEVSCNLQNRAQRFGEINKDMMGPEVASMNQEESINITKSSHRKRWFDDGKVTEVAQPSPIFDKAGSVRLDNDMNTDLSTKRDKENHHKVLTDQSTEVNEDSQQSTLRPEEGETIHSSSNEFGVNDFANPKTTLSEEGREAETNFISQKDESKIANEFENSAGSQNELELEKQRLIQKEEKRRERERQKEKRKVAQIIREARERSFADVKERVAETRQKVMAEAQGKSGKTAVHTDDASLEKASKEAKAKRERSFVERANAEARDRALEKALSEKAAAEASKQAKWSPASTEKQAKKSVSERFAGSSVENRQSRSLDLESKGPFSSSISRSPNSTNQSDPSPAEQSTNGESAQRCKAILERNQRTAERAAKALAEKNNRDLLVQQEQAERNRLAEAIDAEVKRWSSGKERNLRALLSTLQYILGPDSGWQPVHLTDIVTAVAVKKAYRKAALYVHPDKLQQRGASIQQKYICEKVFDLLKDAWNRFSMEER